MFFHRARKKSDDTGEKIYCFTGDYQWIQDQPSTFGVRFEFGHIMGECYVRTRLATLQYHQLMDSAKRLGKHIERWKGLEINQDFEFDAP